jgi:FkbM family methyltransferase
VLDPMGFNELSMSRSGPMLYNKHDVFVGGSFRAYGEFSFFEQDLFRQIVRAGQVVVEVGANIGGHTVELSRLVGAHGEVHAFEPQRLVFQALCANLALNQCTNVFARQAAVGAQSGQIAVPAMDPNTVANFGGVSLVGVDEGESVPLVTLDEFDLAACHVVKADVEGMELDVLKGAEGTIECFRPMLYVENDRQERSHDLLAWLLGHDYAVYWHVAPLFNPANFYGEEKDIWGKVISVNVLCIPSEAGVPMTGFRQVTSPDDHFR